MQVILLVLRIQWEIGRDEPGSQGAHSIAPRLSPDRKAIPCTAVVSSCISLLLGRNNVCKAVHASFYCPWRCYFLTLACEVSQLTFYSVPGTIAVSSAKRVTQIFKTVPGTRVFILVGAVFFMQWNLVIFSPSIKLPMLVEVLSLESLYKSESLLPLTLCDLHLALFFFIALTTPWDIYHISMFCSLPHYLKLSHPFPLLPSSSLLSFSLSFPLSPSFHPSIYLTYIIFIGY